MTVLLELGLFCSSYTLALQRNVPLESISAATALARESQSLSSYEGCIASRYVNAARRVPYVACTKF